MRVRRLIIVAAVVVVCLAAYVAWSLFQVRGDLLAARADADDLRTALEAGDQSAAEAALADLREHATDAEDGSDGPVFSVLSWLPVVGDDADGVRLVSTAVAGLAEEGLPPLVRTAEDVSGDSFLPRDGQLPLDRIVGLQRPVGTAATAFEDASRTLADGDPGGYVDALASAFDDLSGQVADGADALATAQTATELLPGMLGQDGTRSYVVIFQNNAELRTTGGIPGSSAEVTARDGRIEMGRQTASPPKLPQPVLPLSKAERELYTDQLGEYLQDANFTPHFPRTAELVAAHWERQFGRPVDGVVSFDPVALSYLLEATGPVTVGGQTITGDNAVGVLLHDTYQRLEEPAAQDAFFAQVARTVFDKLTAGEGDSRAVLEALARGVEERRLMVTSFHQEEQELISGTRIAGEVAGEGEQPQMGVYLNDATMSKLTYFLDYEVTDVEVTSCQDGMQTLRGRLELHSDVPEGGAGLSDYILGTSGEFGRRGDQLVQVELHAPQGGKLRRILVDDKKRPVWPVELLGHQVAQTFALVKAQGDHVVEFEMTAPADVTELDVRVTPGVEPESESQLVQVGC